MTNRPDVDIAGATAAHARLLRTLEGLTDDQARRPSLLPGWSVGHVVTHLARNADSFTRMLQAAAEGQAVAQYAGGRAERDGAIAAGAGRPAAALVDDVRTASARLEALWATLPEAAWDGHGFNADGVRRPCARLPFHRWREVEVHQVDLGVGPSWGDWPDDYVARELPAALAVLPDRLAPDDRRRLTAWLLGRAPYPGELDVRGWEEPPGRYDR